MKHSLKALCKRNDSFNYLDRKFFKLRDPKLQEGILVGPQIRKLLHDNCLELKPNSVQLATYSRGFWGGGGGRREMLHNYKALGWVSDVPKINFCLQICTSLPDNLASGEQSQRFHQDIEIIEQRYQGRWDPAMIDDCY
jgi:hypothetical protein